MLCYRLTYWIVCLMFVSLCLHLVVEDACRGELDLGGLRDPAGGRFHSYIDIEIHIHTYIYIYICIYT